MDDGPTNQHASWLLEHHGTARTRAIAGQERDLAACTRDRAADQRDVQARARDALSDKLAEVANQARASSGRDVIVRAAMDRARAFEDRVLAAEQRHQAALDREHAARDRLLSMRDRVAAIAEVQLTDGGHVSGVLARAAGLGALRREIDRAHRTDGALTLVCVNVVDAAPCDIAGALLGGVRSYDLVIAVSDDAFVCALSGVTIDIALARFAAIDRTLTATGASIEIGYAELAAGDTPGKLIDAATADATATRVSSDHDSLHARTLRAVSAHAKGQRPPTAAPAPSP